MSDFSPTDAALEGFRITRERPVALAVWAAAFILSSVVQQVVLIGGGLGPMMQTLSDSFGRLTPGAEQAVAPLIMRNLPLLTLFVIVGLAFSIVMSTAVLRAVLKPAEHRFGYLRLSIDEARQLVLALYAAIVGAGYLFALAVVSAIVSSLVQALGNGPFASLVDVALSVAMVCALIYPAIRLSLAPAMTFADGRVSLFRSWALTRGRFWPLFGAYLMAVLLALVVAVLSGVIFSLIAYFAGGGSLDKIMKPDASSLQTYFTPLTIAYLAFGGVLTALVRAITTAPIAAAFRQISGRVGAPSQVSKSGSPWET